MMVKHIITYTTAAGRMRRDVTADDYTAWTFINDIRKRGATDVGMCERETDEPDTLQCVPRLTEERV